MQPPPLCLVFEETNDPNSRSFFSEIISSISDVKFSHSGRYLMTRDYLSVKIWDLNMENRPLETYQVRGGRRVKTVDSGTFHLVLRGVVHLHRGAEFDRFQVSRLQLLITTVLVPL